MRNKPLTYGCAGLEHSPRLYFRNVITDSDEFNFGMDDIAALRNEMKTLIQNLSGAYLEMKRKEAAERKERKRREKEARKAEPAKEENEKAATVVAAAAAEIRDDGGEEKHSESNDEEEKKSSDLDPAIYGRAGGADGALV